MQPQTVEKKPANLDVETHCIAFETALEISTRALQVAGAHRDIAKIQARHLVLAEAKGHPSHGLLRLPRLVARIKNNVAHPNATGVHTWTGRAHLKVDGARGLGPVVIAHAIDALSARIDDLGIAVATIDNCNHLGMLSQYAEDAANAGFLSIYLTTSEALVHPYGGRRAMIGTNPIAIGVPARPSPFVLDLATSKVSMGKVHAYADLNQPLEPGWAVDASGNPTTDPILAKTGALSPFGDAKGYALGLAFEVLIGALTDCALGQDVQGTLDATEISNKGDFVLLAKPRSHASVERVSQYLADIRRMESIDPSSPVRVPGDGAKQRVEHHQKNGIVIPQKLADELRRLAEAHEVAT